MELCKYGCGNPGIKQLKDGSWICNTSYNKCPVNRKKNSDGKRPPTNKNSQCKFCKNFFVSWNISKHEDLCYLNPKNLKRCPVCNKPIKAYKRSKTCSHKCANNLFKNMGKDHWNYKGDDNKDYRVICFKYHKKECIICGEKHIVAAHHYDFNNKNNEPTNFIPLCPTHHAYVHTNELYYLVKECIDDYHKKFELEYMGA